MKIAAVWPARRKLLAVILDQSGRAPTPMSTARTAQAASALFAWLDATVDLLVLSDAHLPLIQLARAANLSVQLAPHDLLEAIRAVAGYHHRPQRDTAVLLARWPLTPVLRLYLRQNVQASGQRNQLPLL